MLDELNDFIHSKRDAREFKRAVAVPMFIKGYKHREIGENSGFISKWTERYEQLGVQGLKLGYQGSVGYLEPEQRFCGHRLVKAQELLESRGTARIH